MPNTDQAQGAQGRLQVSTSSTFGAGSSVWLEYLSESIVETIAHVNSAGIRGTRTHASERTRKGGVRVSGSIQFECSRILLDNILPAALGATESSNVFDVAETLPNLYFLIDKRTDIVRVNEAKIGRMTLEADQGGIVRVSVEIEAESLTAGQSWPSGMYPERSMPYLFSDLGNITINGTARSPLAVSVTVDNNLDADTFANSRYRDGTISATDRIVTLGVTLLAESANSDLRDRPSTGEAISLVFTHAEEASSVLTIDLGRVAFPGAVPQISGKGTQTLRLEGQSRGLKHPGEPGAVPDIRITNAHA